MSIQLKKEVMFIPTYAIFPLLFCVIVNTIVYFGIGNIPNNWTHYDLTITMDEAIPLIPEFIVIYFGCYLFWIVNYILIARQGKEHCIRFAVADIMARLICAVFFLVLPTTNIRPIITGDGICAELLKWLYQIDAPTKLFPSIHCLVSWFCYIGIRGQKNISKAYKIISFILAILVFISTLVTKQHVIVDVIGAVIIAEVTYYIAVHMKHYQKIERIFNGLHQIFLIRKNSAYQKENKI